MTRIVSIDYTHESQTPISFSKNDFRANQFESPYNYLACVISLCTYVNFSEYFKVTTIQNCIEEKKEIRIFDHHHTSTFEFISFALTLLNLIKPLEESSSRSPLFKFTCKPEGFSQIIVKDQKHVPTLDGLLFCIVDLFEYFPTNDVFRAEQTGKELEYVLLECLVSFGLIEKIDHKCLYEETDLMETYNFYHYTGSVYEAAMLNLPLKCSTHVDS